MTIIAPNVILGHLNAVARIHRKCQIPLQLYHRSFIAFRSRTPLPLYLKFFKSKRPLTVHNGKKQPHWTTKARLNPYKIIVMITVLNTAITLFNPQNAGNYASENLVFNFFVNGSMSRDWPPKSQETWHPPHYCLCQIARLIMYLLDKQIINIPEAFA